MRLFTFIILFVSLFLISCSEGVVREENGSYYNTFSRFGIEFDYPNSYELIVKRQRNYTNIFLRDIESHISVQIVGNELSSSFERTYLSSLRENMLDISLGFSGSESISKDISLIYKGKRYSVPANLHKSYFKYKDAVSGDEVVMLSYFFSLSRRGYVINFVFDSGVNPQEDFDMLSRSFSIL